MKRLLTVTLADIEESAKLWAAGGLLSRCCPVEAAIQRMAPNALVYSEGVISVSGYDDDGTYTRLADFDRTGQIFVQEIDENPGAKLAELMAIGDSVKIALYTHEGCDHLFASLPLVEEEA